MKQKLKNFVIHQDFKVKNNNHKVVYSLQKIIENNIVIEVIIIKKNHQKKII